MIWACQKELLKALPGMENVNILRYGTIHRNIFLDIPSLCAPYLQDRKRPGLYYAGQICGVEGYVESIASGIVVAMSIAAAAAGKEMPSIPENTMIGALLGYVHTPNKNFQPMNANMGIMPAIVPRPKKRKERKEAISRAAIASMTDFKAAHEWLFDISPAARDFA